MPPGNAEFDPFAQPALARVVPTTEAQREVWLAAQLAPEASLAYNEAATLRLHGALDATALQAALAAVVQRHDALRATFSDDGAQMFIAEQAGLAWSAHDLSGDTVATALAAACTRAVELPFDLAHGPLFRAELLRVATDAHVLLLSAHHIVCDGWSWGVIVDELAAAYRAALAGHPLDTALADSFADFAVGENAYAASAECAATGNYWTSRFAVPPPPLDLPADHARPRVRGFASRRCDLALDAPLVQSVAQVARQQGASLYAALLATFAILLQRLSVHDDLVVGVPAAGQAAEGHQSLVGHAVNILPLRVVVDARATFAQTLAQVRGDLLDAFDHQRYTFGTLLKHLALPRDPSRLPLVSVLFNLDRALDPGQMDFGGLAAQFASVPRTFENFELFVNAVQQPDGGLVLECQYATDLYNEASVRLWLRAYASFLRGVCANPEATTAALPWLPAGELEAMLATWNDTRVDFGPERCLHTLVEDQVVRTPDAVAVVDEAGAWTYAQLNAQANRLARHLNALGVGPDVLVAVCAERSRELACGLLAVLKAGGAYVPVDPGYPDARIADMLADCAPRVVLTQQRFAAHLGGFAPGVPVLALDAATPAWASETDANIDPATIGLTPHHLAYVIYTSGSTGKPKGAMNEHRGIVNRLGWMQQAYALDAGDAVLQKTPFTFDVSVWEFFWPLLAGARLVMARPDGHKDPAYLAQVVADQHITTLHFVPSMLQVFLEQADGLPRHALKRVLCSGEALSRPLAERFLSQVPGVPLYNLYGPTEAAVDVTAWTCAHAPAGASVPIGKPIANTHIAILDASGQSVLPGVRGEIHIGGVQVGRGYLNRPGLTAERFIPDPAAGEPGARLYRTGDVGRWRHDGAIEYLGRNDFQVKLRGLRIELGEIEARLASLPGVAQAVVLMREDRPGDQRLVAYLTARDGVALDVADVRAQLAKQVPEYMVPQHFTVLDAIPLNTSGKVDRGALPAPQQQAPAREHVAPRNEREQKIAAIMEDVLALPGLGIHDDFFALGGHSLLAAQMTARLNREFDVSLSLRALFDTPTIAGLAETIAGADHSDTVRIEHRANQSRAPLSKHQAYMWLFENHLAPGTTTYNAPSAHRLQGALNESAFQQAFDAVVERQSVLRTAFATDDGAPVQIIQEHLHVPLFPAEDLSGLPANEREDVLLQHLWGLADETIELSTAPLFHVRLFRLAPNEHVFFFMPHHIIWDGWSFDVFYDDMATFYRAFCDGTEPDLPKLEYSYGDYAAWHKGWLSGADFASQKSERIRFWRAYIDRCGPNKPLPTDFPRNGSVYAGPAQPITLTVSKPLASSLTAAARSLETTPYVLVATAFAVLLADFGDVHSLVMGNAVRVRPSVEFEPVMGHFTEMLPLGLEIDPQSSFNELAVQFRQRLLELLEARDVHLEDLVHDRNLREAIGTQRLFSTSFSFQDARRRQREWGGLHQSQVPLFQRSSPDDIAGWLLDHGDGMTGQLLYRTDLYKPATGEALAERYIKLLESVAAEPNARISDLISRPDGVEPANHNQSDSVEDALPAQIARQAASAPGRIAIEWEGGPAWTYATLMQWSDAVARELVARGVTRGELVGVCVPRRPEMIAAVLGVMRAGAAYVALDPAFPGERLRYMAEHSGVRHVLTWSVAETPAALRELDLLALDGFDPAVVPHVELPAIGSGDLAYVLYTSGSTGKPKGVRILQGNLVNFLASMCKQPGLTNDDVLCAITTLCFDIAVLELYLPLTVGARVVMATEREQVEPDAFPRLLRQHGVTVLQTTPTLLRVMLNGSRTDQLRDLKLLIGGEAMPRGLANAVLPHCRELWNMYGPTETTVWSTVHRMVNTDGPVPLGKPIANTVIHVLDEAREPVAAGAIGEIWIGGAGVADGYLHDPAKTAERFLPDPFANDGSRMYRTGDLGHMTDGVLYFDGRADDQIKLRGYRIEPGDIEAVALAEPGVQEAVAVAREIDTDDRRLLLYVAAAPVADLVERLRARLREQLPAYMVPQHIERLDALPHTPNGKIDRKALPLPAALAESAPVAPTPVVSPLEQALMDIWRELLRVRELGVNDDFFDLGGDSLLAVRVFERTQKLTGVNLPLASLLTAPTIARQVAALRAAGAKEPQAESTAGVASPRRDPWAPLVPIQPKGTRPPIFFVHAIGGNVLNYVRLAKGFNADQPVYGLQALGLDGVTPPLESVAGMATRYATEIRRVQPHGPYFLAGGSMGGAIAYEVAQHLLAEGEAIGMLALFDTYGPANRRLETAEHRRITLPRVWSALRSRITRIGDRVRVRRARRSGQPLSYDLRHREIERAHRRAYLAYVPAPFGGAITLFRANSQPPGIVDRTLGWEASALGGVEVIDIPGHHDDLVEQPELLEKLREVLRRQRQRG